MYIGAWQQQAFAGRVSREYARYCFRSVDGGILTHGPKQKRCFALRPGLCTQTPQSPLGTSRRRDGSLQSSDVLSLVAAGHARLLLQPHHTLSVSDLPLAGSVCEESPCAG